MFLVKITIQKIGEKKALELYSSLISPDITALEKSKRKAKDKRSYIFNVLKNLESVFTLVFI